MKLNKFEGILSFDPGHSDLTAELSNFALK